MIDHIWLLDENDEPVLVRYDELDDYAQLLKPVGHFTYSAEDFMHIPLAEAPFYIKDWLPKQGKAVFYGPAKVGKSFFAVQMSRCIAYGEPFLGLPTQTGRVLYMQFELGPTVLQERLKGTGQNYENVFVGTTFFLKLDGQAGRDVLLHEIEAVQPNVLVLDPFYKILEGDENEAHDVLNILDFLDQVIELYRELSLSIVIFHHSGKDLGRGGRGSSVLEGWVDSNLEIRRLPGAENGELKIRVSPKLLRHAAIPPEPLDLVLCPNFEFVHGERPTTVQGRVVQYFKEHGDCRIQALIDAGIGSRKAIYAARKSLIEEGRLSATPEGLYRLDNGALL